MSYSCRIVDSIGVADAHAWDSVCAESDASIFLDRRFVSAVEDGMKQLCRFWYVLVYDGDRPVACAGLSLATVDIADFGDAKITWLVQHAPVLLSRFRRLKILFCSLPGSPGEKSIAMTPSAVAPQAVAALEKAMQDIASGIGADAIVFKEFGLRDLSSMTALQERGYSVVEIPSMHIFRQSFPSFAEYCSALKHNYRKQISLSKRKLDDGVITAAVLTEPSQILDAYTSEAHDMYRQMVAKSDLKVEVLPIEYYRQLAVKLPGSVELVTLWKDRQVVAFGWCMRERSNYHLMYAGLDYSLNKQYDLYFNLMYCAFDRAFKIQASRIHFGQTATVFKARLGCYAEPLYIYAKGLGPLMSNLFYYGSDFLVIKKPSIRPSDIFRREGQETN